MSHLFKEIKHTGCFGERFFAFFISIYVCVCRWSDDPFTFKFWLTELDKFQYIHTFRTWLFYVLSKIVWNSTLYIKIDAYPCVILKLVFAVWIKLKYFRKSIFTHKELLNNIKISVATLLLSYFQQTLSLWFTAYVTQVSKQVGV